MSPDPDTDLARIRSLCPSQPRGVEKVSHGMPVFFIEKGKTFARFIHNHHGNAITAVALRTSGPEEQAMLLEAEPEPLYRPAYLAPPGWIGLRRDVEITDWDQIEARIEQSWGLAATARLREQFAR